MKRSYRTPHAGRDGRSRPGRVIAWTAFAVAVVLVQAGVLTRQASSAGPPYAPSQALATFRIADGFRIDLFASEPLIASPVAMEIDERGDLYVVEMPGYPLDISGTGRVVRLADTNADGLPDRRTVFADRLRLPTGIMRWKRGFIVTDSPQVWYLEDADGDGRAEIRREMLTGFALSNPQHTTNAPVYGLDNWIYMANEGPVRTIRYHDTFGDPGSEVRFADRTGGPRLPPDADGRNVRFRPDSGELEMLSGRSQFGQTFDPWGHQFLVAHNRHLMHEVIAARYVARNPSLLLPAVIEHVPDYPLPAAVFPTTDRPEFQLLTDIGVMTSACGVTYYAADLFPAPYRTAAFVAEPAHNLVHVAALRDHGATFRASRMFDGQEFLTSSDAWFRPVNLYLGPDGAIYLIDYYRKILEHPEWMDEAIAQSPDVYVGRDRGRIYRIAPAGTTRPSWMHQAALANASKDELVNRLAEPNIWWRRHAQRLLLDRRPPGIAASLAALATSGGSAVGRVHALWTGNGLGQLSDDTLRHALKDPAPGVRENAIRLAELRLANAPGLAAALLPLAADPDPKVRYQLLLTLGSVDTPPAREIRTRMLFESVEDEWMQVAALSAASSDPISLLRTAAERTSQPETPGNRALFSRLGAMSAAAPDPAVMRDVIKLLAAPSNEKDYWWRAATLDGLASGPRNDRRRRTDLDPERALVAALIFEPAAASVRRPALRLLEAIGLPSAAAASPIEERAAALLADPSGDAEVRADAVRLLALAGDQRHAQRFWSVLQRAEPMPVQIAAVRALAEPKGDSAAARFIELWERWTPAVRVEAVRTMTREPGRIRVLLDALSANAVRLSEIEWPLRVRMMMVDDDRLRARARTMLGHPAAAATDAIQRHRAAATIAGDVQRGRDVFARACSTCHLYRGSSGSAFGPDLGEVRGRLPFDLLSDILNPNRSIADGYELWAVELTDGTAAGGIVSAETPTSVTFRAPGGGATTIARARIASMRIAPVSGMPEGLGDTLGVQELADLIAFIKGGS